ncbi:Mannosylphosphate transferase [Balamuthia mandrillaris]
MAGRFVASNLAWMGALLLVLLCLTLVIRFSALVPEDKPASVAFHMRKLLAWGPTEAYEEDDFFVENYHDKEEEEEEEAPWYEPYEKGKAWKVVDDDNKLGNNKQQQQWSEEEILQRKIEEGKAALRRKIEEMERERLPVELKKQFKQQEQQEQEEQQQSKKTAKNKNKHANNYDYDEEEGYNNWNDATAQKDSTKAITKEERQSNKEELAKMAALRKKELEEAQLQLHREVMALKQEEKELEELTQRLSSLVREVEEMEQVQKEALLEVERAWERAEENPDDETVLEELAEKEREALLLEQFELNKIQEDLNAIAGVSQKVKEEAEREERWNEWERQRKEVEEEEEEKERILQELWAKEREKEEEEERRMKNKKRNNKAIEEEAEKGLTFEKVHVSHGVSMEQMIEDEKAVLRKEQEMMMANNRKRAKTITYV